MAALAESTTVERTLIENGDAVSMQDFALIRVLGKGAYGKVFLVKKIGGSDNGQFYAMKVIKKERLIAKQKTLEHALMERKVLERLRGCPFLVNMCYAFQSESKLHIVMEYVSGGELFLHLCNRRFFPPNEAKILLGELALALNYIHQNACIYRDLKLENILVGSDGHLKLTDFGLSKAYKDAQLLTGCSPFTVDGDHNSAQEVARRVLNKPVPFPKTMDDISRQFISSLLDRNPATRLGINGFDDIKNHEFFRGIDFSLLEQRKVKSPIQPVIQGQTDVRNFAIEFTCQKPVFTPADCTNTFQSIFRGYSFVSPSVIFSTNNVIGEEGMEENISMLKQTSPFFVKYELSMDEAGCLGKGSFSICRKCRRISDGKLFAVKIISERFVVHARREVRILEQVNPHKNIVRFEEVIVDPFYHYIVEELLTGGELLDRIRTMSAFTESTAAKLMNQLVSAVAHIHSRGVVHRDLKPENILFQSNDPNAELKLVDFGFARLLPNSLEQLNTPCFTLAYAAPEVLEMDDELPQYNQQCDIWSLGVILYTMLSGNVPFHFKNKNESATDIITRIRSADFEMTGPVWDCVSTTAKNLITGLLTVSPTKRLNMSQLVQHPWLKQCENGDSGSEVRELKTPAVLPERAGECFNETMNAFLNANRDGFQLMNVDTAPLLVKRRGMKRRSSSFSSKKSGAGSTTTAQKLDAVPETNEMTCSTSKRPTTLNIDMIEETNGTDQSTASAKLSAAFTEIRDTKPPDLKYSRDI
ncbi:Ribosomal protein S6 kinase [Aphelenchoides besseyi]|nr:Ribosomal protein S6 kinase [Aphelenchoides besseyi]